MRLPSLTYVIRIEPEFDDFLQFKTFGVDIIDVRRILQKISADFRRQFFVFRDESINETPGNGIQLS